MPIQLMKLRGVPEDELDDLFSLLDEAEIDYYHTTAGNWGISLPALWLRDESQLSRARELLEDYQKNRYMNARQEYEKRKAAGETRGWLDLVREDPFRFILYMALVLLLIYVSTIPWFGFGADNA